MQKKFSRKHNASLTPKAKELRKNMTPAERKLWYCFLRTYPVRILRQKVIGNYIVDFYCAKVKLAIELDGEHHYCTEFIEADKKRTEEIKSFGVDVIRFQNNEVYNEFEAICNEIDLEIKARLFEMDKSIGTRR